MRLKAMAGMAAVSALLLSACGGGDDFADQTAAEILKAAEADMTALKSLRMKGNVANDGQEINLDLVMTTSGDCSGNVGVEGVSAEIMVVGGNAYLRGDEAFWEAAAGEAQAAMLAAVVGSKWVNTGQVDGFSELCDIDDFISDMFDDTDGATKGETKEINGRKAIGLTSDEDDSPVGWIAVESPHHVLRMESGPEAHEGAVDFTDFDQEVTITAPADDDVFDVSALSD